MHVRGWTVRALSVFGYVFANMIKRSSDRKSIRSLISEIFIIGNIDENKIKE